MGVISSRHTQVNPAPCRNTTAYSLGGSQASRSGRTTRPPRSRGGASPTARTQYAPRWRRRPSAWPALGAAARMGWVVEGHIGRKGWIRPRRAAVLWTDALSCIIWERERQCCTQRHDAQSRRVRAFWPIQRLPPIVGSPPRTVLTGPPCPCPWLAKRICAGPRASATRGAAAAAAPTRAAAIVARSIFAR